MRVKVVMRSPVATVGPEATIDDAKAAMTRDAVPEVPVVDDDGALLGIVTARDVAAASVSTVSVLAQWECPVAARRVRVRDAMTDDRWAVPPEMTIADVARGLATRRRHAVPVLDDRRVVGLVTARRVLAILLQDLPAQAQGPRHIVVRVGCDSEAPAVLGAAVDLVREHQAKLTVVQTLRRWPGIEDEPLASDFIADTARARLAALLPSDVRTAARVVLVRDGDGRTAVVDAARHDQADLIIADAASAPALMTTSPCAVLAIPASKGAVHAHR